MTLKVNVSRCGWQKRDETAGLRDSLKRQTSICKGPGNVENPERAILPPSPLTASSASCTEEDSETERHCDYTSPDLHTDEC